jgi:Tfp pilus assembly major pilin PilA
MEITTQMLEKFYKNVISTKINMQDVSIVVLRAIMLKIVTKKKCVIIVNKLGIKFQSALWEKYVIFASNLDIKSLIVLVTKTTVLNAVN